METTFQIPEFSERDADYKNYTSDPGKDIEYIIVKAPNKGFVTFADDEIQQALTKIQESVSDLTGESDGDDDTPILTETNHRIDWWCAVRDGYVFPRFLSWIPIFQFPAYDWQLIGDASKLEELLKNQTPDTPVLALAVSIFMFD